MALSDHYRLLVTGGAGFVGANLAVALAERHPEWEIVALDNLKRRGSELNLPRLRSAGVEFVHGDVREPADLEGIGRFDAMVEASAEPSALAGAGGSTAYVVGANFVGAYNCLELARRHDAQARIPLHQPGVSRSGARVGGLAGGRDAIRIRRRDRSFRDCPRPA